MKTEEIKRWEVVECRGKQYLRDRHRNEGILIEVHQSQLVTECDKFITVYSSVGDFNLRLYCSRSFIQNETGTHIYIFKKKGDALCYTLFQ